ncbi:MAG TPA: hypothetical protein VH482_37915 [Thermomicrobiales bacterium]|jgi:hypothetical protein
MSVNPTIAKPTLTLALDPPLDTVVATVLVPSGTTSLFLSRVGPSGTQAYVRGASPATFSSNPMILRDYEAPLGVPLTYTAIVADASGAQSPPDTKVITIPALGCSDTWVVDIAVPSNSQRVTYERLDELDYEATTGVHYVLNRRTPIVTSDIARAPKLDVSLLTDTDDQRERARAALGNGVPILLRTPPENGIGNLYVTALEWREQRVVNLATNQARRFLISAVQVDRPDPGLFIPMALASYLGIRNGYASYAALKAARGTYEAVVHDTTVAGAYDVVPWPPDDV